MKQKAFLCIFLVLMLAMSACNLPMKADAGGKTTDAQRTTQTSPSATRVAGTDTPSPSAPTVTATIATPTVTPTTTTQTVTPTTATDTPTATQVTIPCNAASFVSDVTIPDDSPILTGSSFVKTWQLKNVGSCTWTSAYQLIFAGGDAMNAPAASPLTPANVPPNSTVNVSVSLTAPGTPGSYQDLFKLRAPDNTIFGIGASGADSFWVKITAFTNTNTPAPASGIHLAPVVPFLPKLNTATLPPIAIAFPDLTVSSILFPTAAHTSKATTMVITVNVYNAGNAATNGSFRLLWWGFGTGINNCSWTITDPVPAHGSVARTCYYTYSAIGAKSAIYAKAQVDSNNTIAESNEGNNITQVQVPVANP